MGPSQFFINTVCYFIIFTYFVLSKLKIKMTKIGIILLKKNVVAMLKQKLELAFLEIQ